MLSIASSRVRSIARVRAQKRSFSESTTPVYHNSEYRCPELFTESVLASLERKLRSQPRLVLKKPSHAYAFPVGPEQPVRRAAVLIPLINWAPKTTTEPQTTGRERAALLYSLRASTLRNHGGQVAFPGGVMDPEDEGDPIKTALRETAEEIGIDASLVRPLGLFHDVTSLNGIIVTPVLAHIPNWSVVSRTHVKLSRDEVDEVFEVPLASLIDPSSFSVDTLRRGNLPRYVVDPNRKEKDVWGMTAYITDWLLRSTFSGL